MHATFFRNRIITALRSDTQTRDAAQHVSQNFVFEHPTVHALAEAIVSIIHGAASGKASVEEAITAMVDKYTADLPTPNDAAKRNEPLSQDLVVLMTGSTGGVGSHILATLLENVQVKKVYTLNRVSSASQDRQRAMFVDRRLNTELLNSEKLVQLFGDVTQTNFGLSEAHFVEVRLYLSSILRPALTSDYSAPRYGDTHRPQRLESRLQSSAVLLRDQCRRNAQAR